MSLNLKTPLYDFKEELYFKRLRFELETLIGDNGAGGHTLGQKLLSITINTKLNFSGCKIIMYEKTGYRGQVAEVTGDMSDFNDISFDNAVQSLKIEGNCCWTILTEPNYRGDSIVLMKGEYDRNTADIEEIYMKASSARNKCF